MDLQDNIEIEIFTKSFQWTVGQIFPELISPGHMPLSNNFKYPTNIFTVKFNDSVNVQGPVSFDSTNNTIINTPVRNQKLWIYFAPLNDILTIENPENLETLTDHFTSYSCSNGPSPLHDVNEFNFSEILYNGSSKFNASLNSYKKLRLNSAAIHLKLVCPEKDQSGVLRIGMMYKSLAQKIPSFSYVDFDQNFALSKTINMAENSDVICRYRMPYDQYDKFGPYDIREPAPYFFVLGEGLPLGSCIDVTYIRHFEGVPKYIYSQINPSYYPPIYSENTEIQSKIVLDLLKEDTFIEAFDSQLPLNITLSSNAKDLMSNLVKNSKHYIQFNQLKDYSLKFKAMFESKEVVENITNFVKEELENIKKTFGKTAHDHILNKFIENIDKKNFDSFKEILGNIISDYIHKLKI